MRGMAALVATTVLLGWRVAGLAQSAPAAGEADGIAGTCTRCGAPSTNEVCAFCRLVERTDGAEPVVLTTKGAR